MLPNRSRTFDIAAMLVFAAVLSLLALTLGRDLPWDYFNYHAYAVELLADNRLTRDFFAAGPQGYFNPVGFIPLALAQHLQLGSMATAVMLASLHSLSAFFLYLICRDLSVSPKTPSRVALGLGWLLGVSTPVFLSHVGSTGVDQVGTVLVMAATWLALFRPQARLVLLAGALAGIAVAVKLSNVVFAVAIAMAIALPFHENVRQWRRRVACGAVGMLGGFLLAQGWWSWRLQEATGNPFFPFFNSIFRSPYLSTESSGALRFVPSSPSELLALPFRLTLSQPWTYIELSAPTAVPLAVCVIALAVVAKYLVQSISRRPHLATPGPDLRLCLMVLASAALWVATSTNGRYGIPLFMLLGPTLSVLSLRLLPSRYAALFLGLMVSLQVYTVGFIGVERWYSSQWTPRLLPIEAPATLREKPQLFLSIASPSHSEVIPVLHPDSIFVNVRGSYSIPSSGATGQRLEQLLSQYRDRTQVVFLLPFMKGLTPNIEAIINKSDALIDRMGLRLLRNRCSTIRIDSQRGADTRFNKRLGAPAEFELMSCSAVRVTPNPQLAELRLRATTIMDAFEDRCPGLFLPSRPQIEGTGLGWVRKYANYDSIALSVNFDRDMLFYGLSGQTSPTYIGPASQWQKIVADFECVVPAQGKRGIEHFNEYEKDAIWFE